MKNSVKAWLEKLGKNSRVYLDLWVNSAQYENVDNSVMEFIKQLNEEYNEGKPFIMLRDIHEIVDNAIIQTSLYNSDEDANKKQIIISNVAAAAEGIDVSIVSDLDVVPENLNYIFDRLNVYNLSHAPIMLADNSVTLEANTIEEEIWKIHLLLILIIVN